MAIQAQTNYLFSLTFLLVIFLCSFSCYKADITCQENAPFHCDVTRAFNRTSFKKNFIFGAATSAFQVEGIEGRAFNTWDTFTHRYPEKTPDRSTGDIAVDSLHFYQEDVNMLNETGLGAYRFSIAWSRILPKGRLNGGINHEGINYYNRLIDALVAKGIKPFVTLYHWDMPQTLEDEYGGFLSPCVVKDYKDYVNLCFEKFGDRVKHWITLNQPYTVSRKGYGDGSNAPNRCSFWQHLNCSGGDSGTEPYLTTHHQLLAHAAAVDLYRRKYQDTQKGKIGITLIARWYKPFNVSHGSGDYEASERAFQFMFGWFMNPLTTGNYPQVMIDLVGDRLPKFNAEQKTLLKGSFDFLGLNYYVTQYAINVTKNPDPKKPSYLTDVRVDFTSFNPAGVAIGPKTATFYYYPKGLLELLVYIKEVYKNPLTYITENGFDDVSTLPLDQTLADHGRINYYCSHLCYLKSAIKNGSNVKGYFAWALIDNYEFGNGFTVRFGMNYIDYNNVSDRRPKLSAKWFKRFLHA